jgi:hypothetical protein
MPSQREISRDWQTAPSYVAKCVKRGCPTDSFENARAWRTANASKRATTSPKQIARLLAEERDFDAPKTRARRKKYSAKKSDGYRFHPVILLKCPQQCNRSQ